MAVGRMTVYRGCEPVADERYGGDAGKSPAEAVVDALSAATGLDQRELGPLYESIDPDALEQLFAEHGGAADSETLLCFRVEEWKVFVHADGRVRVCDGTESVSPAPVFD